MEPRQDTTFEQFDQQNQIHEERPLITRNETDENDKPTRK